MENPPQPLPTCAAPAMGEGAGVHSARLQPRERRTAGCDREKELVPIRSGGDLQIQPLEMAFTDWGEEPSDLICDGQKDTHPVNRQQRGLTCVFLLPILSLWWEEPCSDALMTGTQCSCCTTFLGCYGGSEDADFLMAFPSDLQRRGSPGLSNTRTHPRIRTSSFVLFWVFSVILFCFISCTARRMGPPAGSGLFYPTASATVSERLPVVHEAP
ncbi:fibroblast growth factor 8 isoform X3 [Mauremys mutica]|uniref:fibroblast growth factor 8 isoform X3 n=1 Tax=Mauremys mutica TaxID=74926 RepID=UPI001D15FB2F|nr:fibroblast growth factor 8 isoform X3 [Mauremys mutica]